MSDALHVVCPHCNTVNRVPGDRLSMHPDCGKCGRPVFTGRPAELDAIGFEKQLGRSDIPVLVDFWAPWCGPCRAMAPAYEQAARELEPAMRVVKLNTEEAQELAAQHGIRSIPTLALFRNGREIARQAGAMDAGSIVAWARRQSVR
jgi:thioredoxin 2